MFQEWFEVDFAEIVFDLAGDEPLDASGFWTVPILHNIRIRHHSLLLC
jgi:hypothetical protein